MITWIIIVSAVVYIIAAALKTKSIGQTRSPQIETPTAQPARKQISDWIQAHTPSWSQIWQLVVALAGLAFVYVMIWQGAPEFWEEWYKSPGFWFVQAGFVVAAILFSVGRWTAGIVGVFVLMLTLIMTGVSSCQSGLAIKRQREAVRMAARQAVPVNADPTKRRWVYGYIKLPGMTSPLSEEYPAQVIYYDQARFDWKAFCSPEAIYRSTNVTSATGTGGFWEQQNPNRPNKPERGEWFLKPSTAGSSPREFTGLGKNPKGETYTIYLRAID